VVEKSASMNSAQQLTRTNNDFFISASSGV